MKPIAMISTILIFAGLIFAGHVRAAEPEAQPTLKIYRQPSENLLGKRLYVEFKDSPVLTSFLRRTLGERGYQLAESAEASEAQLRFMGNVSIGLFATNPSSATLAEVIEKGALKINSKEDAAVGTTTVVDVAIMNQMARPFGTSFRNSMTLTGVLDWIAEASGLRGAFNKALTGDPRGICMHRDCDKYRQRVVISALGSATWLATYEILDEKIVLDRLIEQTLERALEPLSPK
ncbi:MAG: hypothetical protein DPW12_13035 [Rhodocyclaceae bacterium]|nr:hypothetical protein [Bacteroidia bacterium]MCQ3925089.1 hypothetical protein [Rhodocyclaceae bacterium]